MKIGLHRLFDGGLFVTVSRITSNMLIHFCQIISNLSVGLALR